MNKKLYLPLFLLMVSKVFARSSFWSSSHSSSFSSEQEMVNGLTNNNADRVALLKTIPGAVEKFEALFAPHKEYIEAWGYSATL